MAFVSSSSIGPTHRNPLFYPHYTLRLLSASANQQLSAFTAHRLVFLNRACCREPRSWVCQLFSLVGQPEGPATPGVPDACFVFLSHWLRIRTRLSCSPGRLDAGKRGQKGAKTYCQAVNTVQVMVSGTILMYLPPDNVIEDEVLQTWAFTQFHVSFQVSVSQSQ